MLKSKFKELYPFVEKAVVETLAEGRIYQASQLLPVLTKLEPKKGAGRVQKFKSLPGIAFGVEANIKEALENR